MTAIRFRSPVTKPLLRAGTPKPYPPDPRAYETFRVTQLFDAPDAFYAERDIREGRVPRTHGAVDVGNFRCGDPVVAMAPGIVRRVKDNATALGAPTDGLGIIEDIGNGVEIVYWHLNGYSVADGARVVAGQQIGIVGRTGLGNVCHLHIEVKVNGRKVDPEPLMFGGSLTIATSGEDDVKIRGRFLRHEQNVRTALTVDSHFRSGDDWTNDSLGVLSAGTALYPIVTVEGRSVGTAGDRAEWHGALAYVASAYHFGFVHSSVAAPFEAIVAADCSAQDATIARLSTQVNRARTSAAGASQAAAATVEALR